MPPLDNVPPVAPQYNVLLPDTCVHQLRVPTPAPRSPHRVRGKSASQSPQELGVKNRGLLSTTSSALGPRTPITSQQTQVYQGISTPPSAPHAPCHRASTPTTTPHTVRTTKTHYDFIYPRWRRLASLTNTTNTTTTHPTTTRWPHRPYHCGNGEGSNRDNAGSSSRGNGRGHGHGRGRGY